MTRFLMGLCAFFLISGFCGAFVKFDGANGSSTVSQKKAKPKGYTAVVYTKKLISSGAKIKASDLEVRKIWALGSPLSDQTFSSIEEVEGKKANGSMSPNHFILKEYVQ